MTTEKEHRGYAAKFHVNLVESHGTMRPERIVLHSTESEGDGWLYGDSIVGYWKRQGLGYGAHFVVSADGVVTDCLNRALIAWHVQDRNTGSIGIEQSGYAHDSTHTWMVAEEELDATARLIARMSHNWAIPLDISTERGVSTHAMQSAKYGGSHTDPGPDYPLSHVMGMARSYANAGGWIGVWNASGRK